MTRLFILILVFVQNSFAIEGVYTVIVQKQEQKKQSRWSLADWLATKKRIALMDQWLALNTESNIFEMIVDYQHYEFDDAFLSETKVSDRANLKMFVTLLGLEAEKEWSTSQLKTNHYNLSLRLLGSSQQSTHVNLLWGYKEIETRIYGDYRTQFYGAEGDLYLLSFLGASGRFEKIRQRANTISKVEGEKSRFGGFLEFYFIRLYYHKTIEKYSFDSGTSVTRKERNGDTFGISLYL
ncbi:hypothetical protein HBN50_03065 [Halobacteriovorax sp. GB3]|uniref:hypothetical protein n=1 Tax=Halobacteriovorax sp. GB3 TaxID=2719615 RepID=UPI00235DE2D3|nr:hypothetical protein [Halobacteriovorax sp. GB3]MDD0852056.1 hypothetical protein [Halobacteriovorax sp. GB3]